MRLAPTLKMILAGLLVSTSAVVSTPAAANDSAANESGHRGQTRAEFHAAQDPGIDAAVHAIVQELAAVGSGPRDTRVSNPSPAHANEAAAARALRLRGGTVRTEGADEGGDDHAM